MAEEVPLSKVRQTIEELATDLAGEDGELLCRWVLVSEWMNADTGDRTLRRTVAENMAEWDVRGLLHTTLFDGERPWEDSED